MCSDSSYTISSYVEVLYIASTLLICWVPKHVLSENLINNGVSCSDVANKVKSVALGLSSRSMALSSGIEFGKSAEEGLQAKKKVVDELKHEHALLREQWIASLSYVLLAELPN